MNFRCLILWLAVSGVYLTTIGCQDPRSLALIWSVRWGHVGQWSVRGDETFTVGRYMAVYSLTTGQELRRARLPQDYGNTTRGEISPEVAISMSTLVFGWYDFDAEEGRIFSYDPKTLKLRWQRSFKWRWNVRETRPTFSLVIDGAYLYALAIGKEGENLFKLRLSDGETVWSTTIEKYVPGIPLVLHNGKLLVRSVVSLGHPNQYGYLQAIKPETGDIFWRLRIDGLLNFDDLLLISGDRAYMTSESVLNNPDHFYTVDLSRGTIIDYQPVRNLRAPFAQHRGILYFGGNTPAAFDINRKVILWQTDLRGPGGIGEPVGANGVLDPIREEVYIGDSTRHLYILSSTTGQVKGKINIRSYWRGDVLFNPVKAFFASYGVKRLELNQGFLLVGTVDSSLFVFRRTEKK